MRYARGGVSVVLEVADRADHIRVELPLVLINARMAMSLGEPENSLFENLADLSIAGLSVFVDELLPDEERAVVRRWLMEPPRAAQLASISLVAGERIAVYGNMVVLTLRPNDPKRVGLVIDTVLEMSSKKGSHEGSSLGPVRAICRHEYIMSPLAPGSVEADTRHWFGGHPPLALPECRNCKRPVHSLAWVAIGDVRLDTPLDWPVGLPVVACLNCAAISEPAFFQVTPTGITVVEQGCGEVFGEFPEEFPKTHFALEPVGDDQASIRRRPIHGLGGEPVWIQAAFVPDCPMCEARMLFAAQLDSDTRLGYQFEDDGMLYCFVCPTCRIVATFAQGH